MPAFQAPRAPPTAGPHSKLTERRPSLTAWAIRITMPHGVLPERSSLCVAIGSALTLLVAVVAVVVVIERNNGQLRYWFNLYVNHSRLNRIPCDEWPTLVEAQHIVEEHTTFVMQLERMSHCTLSENIYTFVYLREQTCTWNGPLFFKQRECPGKVNLTIQYLGTGNRKAIEETISDEEYFYGIPIEIIHIYEPPIDKYESPVGQ